MTLSVFPPPSTLYKCKCFFIKKKNTVFCSLKIIFYKDIDHTYNMSFIRCLFKQYDYLQAMCIHFSQIPNLDPSQKWQNVYIHVGYMIYLTSHYNYSMSATILNTAYVNHCVVLTIWISTDVLYLVHVSILTMFYQDSSYVHLSDSFDSCVVANCYKVASDPNT